MQRGPQIFPKIFTNPMQRIISYIVGEHQTCAIRGRTVQTNALDE